MCLCKKVKKKQPLKKIKKIYKIPKNNFLINHKIKHQNGMQL